MFLQKKDKDASLFFCSKKKCKRLGGKFCNLQFCDLQGVGGFFCFFNSWSANFFLTDIFSEKVTRYNSKRRSVCRPVNLDDCLKFVDSISGLLRFHHPILYIIYIIICLCFGCPITGSTSNLTCLVGNPNRNLHLPLLLGEGHSQYTRI